MIAGAVMILVAYPPASGALPDVAAPALASLCCALGCVYVHLRDRRVRRDRILLRLRAADVDVGDAVGAATPDYIGHDPAEDFPDVLRLSHERTVIPPLASVPHR